jgi:hypothetical protein
MIFTPNIIWVIKLRTLRWAGHIARMREKRGAHRILVGTTESKSNLKDLGVDGKIILKRIFKKWDGET